MVKNPFEEKVPDDKRQQIHDFARDLAWGVIYEGWRAIMPSYMLRHLDDTQYTPLTKKWGRDIPDYHILLSYGYLAMFGEQGSNTAYHLTKAAFDLLDQAVPATVFISYCRAESSALALLLVERLRAIGISPYLDMKAPAVGTEWHAALQKEITSRDHFVCILGPKTLHQPHVCQEIKWAQAAGNVRILPVHHNGFTVAKHAPADVPPGDQAALRALLTLPATIVADETPKDYCLAIDELLNIFGYIP